MPITVACLGCSKQLTFPEKQAGILPLCAACVAEMSAPWPKSGARTADAAKSAGDAGMREAVRAELAEEPVPVAELVEESSEKDLLELGPRWRQMETAFAWVRFGVYALIMGLVVRSFAAFFNVFLVESPTFLVSVLPYMMLAAAGFALFIGQLLCLRVPTGTRARPAAITALAARILAFGLSLYGAISWWEAETNIVSSRESALLTSFALLLGGWIASLLAEFSFVAFVKRVGRFLGDAAVVRHTRKANWILIAYTVAVLVLSAAGVAFMYKSFLVAIEPFKLQFPHAEPRPLAWLLNRISDLFLTTRKARADIALAQLGVPVVTTIFWIALGNQYWDALTSASAAIKAGLARGAAD